MWWRLCAGVGRTRRRSEGCSTHCERLPPRTRGRRTPLIACEGESLRRELVLKFVEMTSLDHDGGFDGTLLVAVHDAQRTENRQVAGQVQGLVLLLGGDSGGDSVHAEARGAAEFGEEVGVPPLIFRLSVMTVPWAMAMG